MTGGDTAGLRLEGRQIRTIECAHCHRQIRRIMHTVSRPDATTFGVSFASLHDGDAPDAWIDVILGTFGEGAPPDHLTFGCRVVPDTDSGVPVVTAVDAAAAFTYRPVMGRRLSRDEALEHPRIDDFWQVVDLMLLGDPDVRTHVYRHD